MFWLYSLVQILLLSLLYEIVLKNKVIKILLNSFTTCFFVDKGTPYQHSWIWQWLRPSQSSLPGRFRKNNTSSSARRTRRQWLDISRSLGRRRLLLHGLAWSSAITVVLFFQWDTVSRENNKKKLFLQLEESNKTLTKDVENLSKEKAELNEKLRAQEEGAVLFLTFMSASCVIIILLFKLTLLNFDRVCSSEGGDCKYNQELWEGPQHRAHT